MSVTKSLYLVKDFQLKQIQDLYDDHSAYFGEPRIRVRILEKDVRRRQQNSSRFTPAIMDCVKELENRTFLIFSSMEIRKGCHLYLHKSLVKRFCTLLAEPILRIRYKMRRPMNSSRCRTAGTVFETSLRLADALEWFGNDGVTSDWYKVSVKYPSSESKGRQLTCDLILGWEEPASASQLGTDLASSLQSLFLQERSKDLTLVAGNGSEIRCHRMVFEAHSDVLAAMVSPHNGMVESTTGRVELKENSEEGLNRLIRYLYGMELITEDMTCDVAVELLLTAHRYMMPELASSLVKMMLGNRASNWFTQDGLLELYFHAKNLEGESREWAKLANHSLLRMTRLTSDILACELYQELRQTDPSSATQLCERLTKLHMEQGARLPAKRKWGDN